MEISPIKMFIVKNNLRQADIAKYLGVSRVTVSRYVNGTLGLSKKQVNKLVNNSNGWDVSMFEPMPCASITSSATGHSKSSITIASGNNSDSEKDKILIASLQKEIEMLREQLREEKQRSAEYLAIILDVKRN